jgi:hypothetical protein
VHGTPGPERSPSAAGRPRWGPILFTAVLAALLASFPARNSDLWMHLAAGRELAQWRHPFGSAPDPTWLYDLLSYGLYSALGGGGLVFLKAVLVVALALLLLRLSRSGPGWRLPAACTALALLAMGTRLTLQPATLSCLLLALTLWFLPLRAESPSRRLPSALSAWPLFILFVLWVNLDRLFVIGLGTVALVWLGRSLDSLTEQGEGKGAKQERPASLGLRSAYFALGFALLAAVCLLNPSHVYAFLPPEHGWFGPSGSSASALGSGPVASPFRLRAYFASLGIGPASIAYFPLLGLGLLAFFLNRSRWRWERFLPWLGLALLSALQARAIPFFAVLAGPVLAWNLQEISAKDEGRKTKEDSWPILVLRTSSFVLAVGLLVCAWPGWLQGPPFEPRRWGVEFPPALERGAAMTRSWHEQGKLGSETRGLHLSRETADAFAWFCPEENALVDDGLTAALRGDPGAPDDWEEVMRAHRIDHVVVYDSDRGRLLKVLGRLVADPGQWPLLYQDGDLAVFGWRGLDPTGGEEPFRGLEMDLNRLAFHPAADQRAPRKGPEREPEVRNWWVAFWKPSPPRPIDRDEATLDWLLAEARRWSAPYYQLIEWEAGQSAALIGAAGGWTVPGALLEADLRLVLLRPPLPEAGGSTGAGLPPLSRLALAYRQQYNLERDDSPPALLYLAVRAARRALAINPDDAQAHLALGEAYLRLLRDTRERAWGQRVPELVQLRRAQASTALNRAALLKPDLARAHLRLAELYQEMGFLDLALAHLRASQKSAARGKDRETDDGPDKELGRLAQTVAERESAFAAESARSSVLDRAMLAFDKGLAGKARDLLLASDLAAFGPQGMAMELELQLRTGRADKVRDWTDPEQIASLGATSYHWLRTQALAALGDYALAQEECEQLASEGRGREASQPREAMAGLVGQAILDEQPVGASVPDLLLHALGRAKFQNRVAGLAKGLRDDANANVFRGLLALEEGAAEEAEVAFRLALDLWKDEAAAASGAGLDFKTRPIAEGCLRWLEQGDEKVTR